MSCRRLHHRVDAARHGERQAAPVGTQPAHAGEALELLGWDAIGELDAHATQGAVREHLDAFDRHQAPFAEDADAGAEVFHLGKVVRRDEYGGAVVAQLADQSGELLLHEGIETGCRLVHHDDGRTVDERLNQAELLLVSA